jgi:POT family proton-dependent oligopeptide transporter
MGINLGALISPVICGYVGERISWRLGFGVAGLGMLAGVVQYLLTSRHLGSAGLHPASTGDPEKDLREKKGAMRTIGMGLAVVAVLAALGISGLVELNANMISDGFGWCLLAISVVIFSYLIFFGNWSPVERKRCAAILVLFVSSSLFWAAYEQAGSSLSFFAERGTDCTVLGYAFPASWYQSVQPVFVVLLAPVFAWIWLRMGRREPSSPAKFSLGLLFGGLAFVILVPAAYTVVGGSKVGPYWLTGTYFLQTLGELCLSPVGLSAMTKLAPARAAGFIMGIWFLTNSIGNWLAGKAASMYSSVPLPTLFGANAAFSIAAAIVLALMIKPTVRLMQGVK